MSDTPAQRLGSIHLEDLAIVALTSRDGVAAPAHPDLDDDRRGRLRSRIKQVSRHDWPASLQEDPLVRRGYTLRQCLRLVVALMLIDARLAPSFAIAVARANESTFLKVMIDRIGADPGPASPRQTDVLAVMMLGELVELVAQDAWDATEPLRVRFVKRQQLAAACSAEHDLAHGGQRLVLDVGAVAVAVWQWLSSRRLMAMTALDHLIAELAASSVGYVPGEGQIRRR